MKMIFLNILFIISITVFAQRHSGKVIYKVYPIVLEMKTNNEKSKMLFEKTKNFVQNQNFFLEFNSNISKFYLDESILANVEKNSQEYFIAKLAGIRFTTGDDFYIDFDEKKILKKTSDGTLVSNDLLPISWEITTETKIIDQYLCYKAIYMKKYIARNGQEKSLPVTVWFAPSLPYHFGPLDYNGLPGLILELTERETTYYAATITILDKEIEIKFPKGKTIPKEEYEKRLKSNLATMIKGS